MQDPSLLKNLEIIFTNAVNYQINKQMELAEEGYLACIESEYRVFDCLHNLGFLYVDTQDYLKAEYVYLQMIEIKRADQEAYVNLGSLYDQLGQYDKAIRLYEIALGASVKSIVIYNNLGVLYKEQGRKQEALSVYVKGLLLEPKNASLQSNFSNLIRGMTLPSEFMKDDSIEMLFNECLLFPSNEYQDYTIAIMGYLFDKYALQDGEFDNEHGYLLLENSLFQHALRKIIFTNLDLEYFLIKVRKEILQGIVNKTFPKKKLRRLEALLYSLAIQCFWTEYVYIVDDDEESLLQELDQMIMDAIKRKEDVALCYAALSGCYSPLYSKRFINNKFFAKQKDKNSIFKDLFRVQVKEPLEEKTWKDNIDILNPLIDEVSLKVAQQYEENPYPRWTSVKKLQFTFLEEAIRIQLPLVKELNCHYENNENIEVLIAGSGTGKHPIEASQQIYNANVTGVDLSRASIAYAQRKTAELGVKNIKFIQGNILDLKLMRKQFDLIESIGVIHHMDDPMAGWRVLTDILKPNGYMKIGLYSELARRSVLDTISFVEEKCYEANLADIRKCRNDIYKLDPTHSMRRLANYIDFYSVSGTRDLIFNVQEHRFTIPKIKASIEALGLKFLGFSFRSQDVGKRYLEMFPQDTEGRDLNNWHKFEMEYPDTFIEMYHFWLQK